MTNNNDAHDITKPSELEKALATPQTPEKELWTAFWEDDSGRHMPVETIGDRKYWRLYENPRAVSVPAEALGQAWLMKIYIPRWNIRGLKREHDFYRIGDGLWFSDDFSLESGLPTSWYHVLLAEPEWFDGIRKTCESWGVNLPIVSDSLTGLASVDYMHSRCRYSGSSLHHNPPVFLLCQLGVDDYVFSDKRYFYYAHILNGWEWDDEFDKVHWRVYKSMDLLIPRHCYRDGSRVPLAHLPQVLYSIIGSTIPTFSTTRYVYSSEDGYQGKVYLLAYYGVLKNGAPHGVRKIELLVCAGGDDPLAMRRTLFEGDEECIFEWLVKPEEQDKIVEQARAMLRDYEDARASSSV